MKRDRSIRRFFWRLTWGLFFRPTPKKFFIGWRKWLLKLFGANITGHVFVASSVKVLNPWLLTLQRGVCIDKHVDIKNTAMVSLGERVTISQGSILYTQKVDLASPTNEVLDLPIELKSQVWVAVDTYIGAGVTMGEGSVAGACAVVEEDVAEWTVVGGHPLKVLSKREFKN